MSLETKAYNRIVLRQETKVRETKKFEATVSPGMILEPSDSDVDVMKPHSVSGGNVFPVWVAMINYLLGEGVGDDYSEGDRGPCALLRSGDKFVGILADDIDYSEGDVLMSNGDGLLTTYTAQTESQDSSSAGEGTTFYPKRIVGTLLEDRDLESSSGNDDSKYARVEVA